MEPICINIPQTTNIETLDKAFQTNAVFQSKALKNQLYHHILSFNPNDPVTNEILEKTALEYVNQAGLDSFLTYVGFHTSNKNKHIHIMSSSNAYRSKKSFRLSKKELRAVQKQMENFQREHFPQLRNSIIYTKKDRLKAFGFSVENGYKETKTDAEIQIQKRAKTPKKELLKKSLTLLAKQCSNVNDFEKAIETSKELSFYYYRNQLQGLVFKERKYRLKTLFQTKQLSLIYRALKYRTQEQSITQEKTR